MSDYKKKSKEKEVSANATWQEYEASMYVTIRWADQDQDKEEEFMVNNAVHVTQALRPTKVLLDNQADTSIIHPVLLRDV